MARLEHVVAQGGQRRQLHYFLHHPVARVPLDLGPGIRQLLIGRVAADDDAVSPRLPDRFDDQLVEPVERRLPLVGLPHHVGLDVGQDRLLAQVVANQVGDIGVNGLVVGHAVADRVAHRHRARTHGAEQAGHAERRVRAERDRIQEGVVDAAVDHIDRHQTLDGAQVHDMLIHHEVGTLDQLYAHLAGEECVLEVRRVVDARRQDHDERFVARPGGRHRLERRAQHAAVLAHRLDGVVFPHAGKRLGHRRSVLDDVADPARIAQIVLEHPVLALGIAHQVDAGDHAVRVVRHADAERVALEAVRRLHQPRGHDAVGHRRPVAGVDVGQEPVQRGDALCEAPLDLAPLRRGDESGEQVHRPGPLGALGIAIDGERDALAAEFLFDDALTAPQLGRVEVGEALHDGRIQRPDGAVTIERFVIGRELGVRLPQFRHGPFDSASAQVPLPSSPVAGLSARRATARATRWRRLSWWPARTWCTADFETTKPNSVA